jgi:glyceraldehyde 3-phosphate dehydrogenase
MIKIGINGFGRIGRILAGEILKNPRFELVKVNDIYDTEMMEYLFKHDSVYGNIENKENFVKTSREDITKLNWDGIDIVYECSGVFQTKEELSRHIKNGSKKVILSSYSKDLPTYIYGLNEKEYKNEDIISASSCTGNCVVPIFSIIDKYVGIKSATITTIHSYTTDQNLLDSKNKDLRRTRSATQNIIPLSSNVANATVQFLPHLKNMLVANSIRVPVINGVLIDVNISLKENISVNEIKNILYRYSNQDITYISKDTFVSSDIKGMKYSSIINEDMIYLAQDNFLKLMLWQDNEYGYVKRLIDLGKTIVNEK